MAQDQVNDKADILIRPMLDEDMMQVVEIEAKTNPNPWQRHTFYNCLLLGCHVWVVEESNKLIGFCFLQMQLHECHIFNITILKERHGEGLGRKLLFHCMDDAKHLGAEKMLLEVRKSNSPAISLYEKTGFYSTGIRDDYYAAIDGSNGREDAILYCYDFISQK